MNQHIEYSINLDGTGVSWSQPAPLKLAFHANASRPVTEWALKGGQWGPVLHNDEQGGYLWIFFSESREECIRSAVEDRMPKRYIIGGDIKVARLHVDSGTWSRPVTLYR